MKSIFQSRTFWFNIISGIVLALSQVGAPQLTDLGLNGVAQHWVLVGIGAITLIGNIYLRSITSTPVSTPLTK